MSELVGRMARRSEGGQRSRPGEAPLVERVPRCRLRVIAATLDEVRAGAGERRIRWGRVVSTTG